MIGRLVFAFALILAVLWDSADARLLSGGGSSISTGDNITALLATMSSGQVKQLSNGIMSDVLPATQGNFDGSPSGTGVAGAVRAGSNANQQVSFSRTFCDASRILTVPCITRGGGHTDYGDGSLYGLNVNTAAGTVLATGTPIAHTILAPGCRLIPSTVTTGSAPGNSVANDTVTTTGASSTNVINVSSSVPTNGFPGNGVYISGAGVPDYTKITAGGGTTTLTLSNAVTVSNGETISWNPQYWCSTNKNGAFMPPTTHTYTGNVVLINSNTVLMPAGPYPWGALGADQPGGASGTYDLGTGATAQGGSFYGMAQWDGSELIAMAPDYTDGFWYTFFLPFNGELQRCTNNINPSCSNILDLYSAESFPFTPVVVADPSPTGGAGKQAYFSDNGPGSAGQGDFFYIDDISHIVAGVNTACGARQGSGNPFPPCIGRYTNDLFLSDDPRFKSYTSDGSHIVVWDGGASGASQLIDITITPGNPIAATMTVEVSTSGGLPSVIDGHCISVFDLGATYNHAKLLDNCGTLYLEKH